MKKLGIIGGAGPLASALFYETLVHESYRLGQAPPEMLIINYPFHRGLTPKESQHNGGLVREELSHCLKALETGGATVGVLVCNTLHLELAHLPQEKVRFLRIPDLVLDAIDENQGKRLLLLATQNTCLSSLYDQRGLTLLRPSSAGQKIVDEVIDRILAGHILAQDARAIEEIIRNVPEEIDGIILGCTDLPVLHHHFPLSTTRPIYDSIKIPAKRVLRFL